MERVLKAEEALEQLVLAIQELQTPKELNDFWLKVYRILNSEVVKQEHRLNAVEVNY